ncbi:Vitamin B12 import ATP-binding protein BtuD [Streptomyces violarus]
MTATLVAKNLAAGHGDRSLFTGLDLVVAPGDVIGLVGANGAGKSTLLRMLAGLTAPEQGELRLSPPTATVGHLPQEPDRRPGETVRAFLARRTGVAEAQRTMDEATQALVDGAPGADDAYATSLERWLGLGGADLDERAEEVADSLGLAVDLDQLMTSLSGGQAARAGLASLLLSRYDVFLLDEPTNDLDLDGLERLERFVSGLRAGTVVVSHDREFLTRTVTKVLELDLAQRRINLYGGGYEAYLEEREVARRHARDEFEEYADKKSALQDRAQMQRSWMDKGVKNARRKAGNDNDKIGRKFRSEASEKQAAKARQTQRVGRGRGLLQLLEDVGDRRQTERLVHEVLRLQRAQHPGVADETRDLLPGGLHHAPDDRVRLRVHAGGVQRVVTAADPQEALRTARTPSGPAASPSSAHHGT